MLGHDFGRFEQMVYIEPGSGLFPLTAFCSHPLSVIFAVNMHFPSLLLAAGSASVVLSQPLTRLSQRAASSSGKLQFVGVNESGPEFGESNIPGKLGTDYTWPDLDSIGTFVNKGYNSFRVNFLMERLVPDQMTGSLDAAYLRNLTETVAGITKLGAYAIIVPHNYGRYNGEIITSTEDFGTFWKTVAAEFKDNDKVIFDTNNEFHDESSSLVANLNQAAINAIRSVGATSQYIAVEGNAYTGAWTWTTTQGTDGKTNGETMGILTDSIDGKLLYQMHQYLDSVCLLLLIPVRKLTRYTRTAPAPPRPASPKPSAASVSRLRLPGFATTRRPA